MQPTALTANALWSVSNLPAYWRFRRALRDPQATQWQKLRAHLDLNASTEFGKTFRFERISSYEEFIRRVPVSGYESFEPFIDRIRRGEPNVLTREPVTHLVPTSGSSGARKLIPFTNGLQAEFNAAIGPWLLDLQRMHPGILCGPAYWSVTPALQAPPAEPSGVRVGFESDTAYLGGIRGRLAEAVMAVPRSVQHARSLDDFRYQTLLHLLRCRDLRLISVWHPSFLTLLLEALPGYWSKLLDEIENDSRHRSDSTIRQIRKANPLKPAKIWPNLCLISCWGDGNAELAVDGLKRLFPNVLIQRKGLLATEAVVTIPFAGQRVLAVSSHFFEFLDAEGRIRLAHQLHRNEEYEVVVTTAGGLCRYRLQDQVRVTGFVKQVPALHFLGRIGNVSDYRGEKLSEEFVTGVIRQLLPAMVSSAKFALLAPDEAQSGLRYTLYLEGDPPPEFEKRLDILLKQNPHYAVCRDLGQLQLPGLFVISARGYETFAVHEISKGKRLGEIKPRSLSSETGWSRRFDGSYFPCKNHLITHEKVSELH